MDKLVDDISSYVEKEDSTGKRGLTKKPTMCLPWVKLLYILDTKKGPLTADEAHFGWECERWLTERQKGDMNGQENKVCMHCVWETCKVYVHVCVQSQACVCCQQKPFLFLEKLLWKTKCLVRFPVQGSLTPASPERSRILTIPPPPPAALSFPFPLVGFLPCAFNLSVLWDQMQISHCTFPKRTLSHGLSSPKTIRLLFRPNPPTPCCFQGKVFHKALLGELSNKMARKCAGPHKVRVKRSFIT